jgi:hypothetical protein
MKWIPPTISTTQLANTIGEPLSKITTWTNRGFIRSATPRRWAWPEALSVAMFARLMRGSTGAAEASAMAVRMMRAIGQAIVDNPSECDAFIFVTAELRDGEKVDHVCYTEIDAAHLLADLMVKRVKRLELIDATDLYRAVCDVFTVTEAKPKVPA